ncbi:MAG TPA: hypothetical protein VM915_05445 [Verrucomicrobiae bacterium]|nr:hypothetical protein [Verrucomicrobiae bacterium]
MSDLTVPIDPVTDAALEEIAAARKRPKGAIAAEALAAYARHEAEIMAKIRRGQEDVRAGQFGSHWTR